jgi:hypothetical protein
MSTTALRLSVDVGEVTAGAWQMVPATSSTSNAF